MVRGVAAFIEDGGTTYQIMGYTPADKFSTYGSVFRRSIASFDRLTDPNALAAQPMRLRLTRAPSTMTLEQFNTQYPSSVSLDEVALINGIAKTDQLRSGQAVKRVVAGSPSN
jgi:predicted Zn-dependent protease